MLKKYLYVLTVLLMSMVLFIPSMASAKVTLSGNLGDNPTAVNNINNLNGFDGVYSGAFNPNNSVTRSEFTKILHNLYKNQLPKKRTYVNNFTDVNSSTKFFNEIKWGYEVGIFDGSYVNNQLVFEPNSLLTRGQIAKVLVTSFNLPNTVNTYKFLDTDNQWFTEYVSTLYSLGITKGVGNMYLPNDSVTRSHLAIFLDNLNTSKANGFIHIPNLIQPNYTYKGVESDNLSWVSYKAKNVNSIDLTAVNNKNQNVGNFTNTYGSSLLGNLYGTPIVGISTKSQVISALGNPVSSVSYSSTNEGQVVTLINTTSVNYYNLSSFGKVMVVYYGSNNVVNGVMILDTKSFVYDKDKNKALSFYKSF